MPGIKRSRDTKSEPAHVEKSVKKTKLDTKSTKPATATKNVVVKAATANSSQANGKQKVDELYNVKSSREAHAKQKQLAKERKAARPNADAIGRAKKLWERLRRKSHVPKEERDTLVLELFGILTGNIRDFVFKHDTVRPIQTALKYATPEQRKGIARELKGEYRTLAESRYAKFLVAKILVGGDKETRSWVIGDFVGHVKQMINHPEAAWILDDTYRQIATEKQKATLLREWYGREFSLFKDEKEQVSADLSTILKENPEKRKPILSHLHDLINQLVQKKMTGFTMLHDAMLQYSIAVGHPSESEQAREFLELLKDDEEGDSLKNLAFTASGCRVITRAIACSNAKDRKNLLRVYKDHISALATDPNGSIVLLAAYEAVDDTVMVAKLVFPDLLGAKLGTVEERYDTILDYALNPVARITLLYPLASTESGPAKWLVPQKSRIPSIVSEVRELRSETSKKQSEKRRAELVGAISGYDGILLSTIANRAEQLVSETFGCHFITEVLLGAEGDKTEAMAAVAGLASGNPADEGHVAKSPAAGRMLKTLVQEATFDPETRELKRLDPRLGFAEVLYEEIKEFVVDWAVSDSSFVIVNMVDTLEDNSKLLSQLKSQRKRITSAGEQGNKGAKLLLEKPHK